MNIFSNHFILVSDVVDPWTYPRKSGSELGNTLVRSPLLDLMGIPEWVTPQTGMVCMHVYFYYLFIFIWRGGGVRKLGYLEKAHTDNTNLAKLPMDSKQEPVSNLAFGLRVQYHF